MSCENFEIKSLHFYLVLYCEYCVYCDMITMKKIKYFVFVLYRLVVTFRFQDMILLILNFEDAINGWKCFRISGIIDLFCVPRKVSNII